MEKVFDLHIHYTFELPLKETITIFKEEFAATGTEKYCFLSLPHEVEDDLVVYDELQNIKGLYLKQVFSPNAYAFAGLVHPNEHANIKAIAQNFLQQAKEYLANGYDGIKMLEGYPSLLKAWQLPLDSPVYDSFYGFMEEKGYPILMHLANPKENWDIETASVDAIQAGRVYNASFPTKREITAQIFRVLEKFPKLKLILAHFGFMSYDLSEAERFLSFPNTLFDITPGGEQLINMQKEWKTWLPFWEKYQNRILYGTDFYAFPKDENWEIAFRRRPDFVRQFLETDKQHQYLDEAFYGIDLNKKIRDKIYRENFIALLGAPKPINNDYLLYIAHELLTIPNKKSKYANDDLQYLIANLSN